MTMYGTEATDETALLDTTLTHTTRWPPTNSTLALLTLPDLPDHHFRTQLARFPRPHPPYCCCYDYRLRLRLRLVPSNYISHRTCLPACLPFLTFLLLLLPLPGTCLIDDTPSWISPPPPPPSPPPLASIALLATKPGRRLVAATCLGFIITLPLPEIRGSVQERDTYDGAVRIAEEILTSRWGRVIPYHVSPELTTKSLGFTFPASSSVMGWRAGSPS
ncbi:hypothetical protein IWZ01DRAFT_314656 [Phyllosticta capitalensis]